MTTLFNATLAYQFIKKLTTPYIQMPAYKFNLIDERGNFLKSRNKMTTQEKNILGYFDVMIINLKKWIALIPGGASRLGTIAAAMLLLRTKTIHESVEPEDIDIEALEEEFFSLVEQLQLMEDGAAAVNSAGSGDVAGIGVPAGSAKGFPPVSRTAANKYKKANAKAAGPLMGMMKRKKVNEEFSLFFSEKTSLEYHKELNSKLWEDGSLKREVKSKLLQIADAWVSFAKLPESYIYDVIITGGNVNYNYTANSDIDLHIVIARNAINPDRVLVDEYLQDKKILWSFTHPGISIYGYPVELYAQDINDSAHQDQGVYSIVQDRWIAQPRMLDKSFEDDEHLQQKVEFYKDLIDRMVDEKADSDSIQTMKSRIKQMRSDSISQGGEFSFGNLVFKDLRNSGYLDKLSNYEKTSFDKSLSLEQYWG